MAININVTEQQFNRGFISFLTVAGYKVTGDIEKMFVLNTNLIGQVREQLFKYIKGVYEATEPEDDFFPGRHQYFINTTQCITYIIESNNYKLSAFNQDKRNSVYYSIVDAIINDIGNVDFDRPISVPGLSGYVPPLKAELQLDSNHWKIFQGFIWAWYIGLVSITFYGEGGETHISEFTIDQFLELFNIDVQYMKENREDDYESWVNYWNYLNSTEGWKTSDYFNAMITPERRSQFGLAPRLYTFYTVDEVLIAEDNYRENIPYGNNSTFVLKFGTDNRKLLLQATNADYITYVNEEGVPTRGGSNVATLVYTDDTNTKYRIQPPGINFAHTNGDYYGLGLWIGRGKDNAQYYNKWIQEDWLVKNSYVYRDLIESQLIDMTDGLNESGDYDIITKYSYLYEETGTVLGDKVLVIPDDYALSIQLYVNGGYTLYEICEIFGVIPYNKISNETLEDPEGNTNTVDEIIFDKQNTNNQPAASATNVGLFTAYNPTPKELRDLADFLIDENLVDTHFVKLFQDPMQAIISLGTLPFDIESLGGKQEIKLGWANTGVSAYKIDSQYQTISLGDIYVKGKYGSYLDYAPYTKVSIYLPYLGIVGLDVNEVMNRNINVTYIVDVITGSFSCTINVSGTNKNLYTYGGNMMNLLPVTAQNASRIHTMLGSLAMDVGITLATSGASKAVTAAESVGKTATKEALKTYAAVEKAGNLVSSTYDTIFPSGSWNVPVQRSGGITSNTGLLNGLTGYLIIERPDIEVDPNRKILLGVPDSKYRNLSELSGYSEVIKSKLVMPPHITDAEISNIRTMLHTGVIF